MSEQEKKRQRIYDLLNAETKPKFLCQPYKKQIVFFFTEKELLRKRGVEDWTQKTKEGFWTALVMVIKMDPTTSIRKYASLPGNCEDSNQTRFKPRP